MQSLVENRLVPQSVPRLVPQRRGCSGSATGQQRVRAGDGVWPADFPHRLVRDWSLADGSPVRIRPIAPSDRHRHLRFMGSLSLQSRYHRLMSARHLLPGELRRMVEIDYVAEMALVAVVPSPAQTGRDVTGDEQEIGVARYVRDAGRQDPQHPFGASAEFAIIVADSWQHRGVGELLLRSLIEAAAAAGISRLGGITLATNVGMIRLARRLGLETSHEPGDWTVRRIGWRRAAEAATGEAAETASDGAAEAATAAVANASAAALAAQIRPAPRFLADDQARLLQPPG